MFAGLGNDGVSEVITEARQLLLKLGLVYEKNVVA